jgi:hypothetical protein
MRDIAVSLAGGPNRLAEVARALGEAGINLEGGCASLLDGKGVAHFLVADGARARAVLSTIGAEVLAETEVLIVGLNQDEPGQFAKLAQTMWDGGVRIQAFYGDHEHHEILVVDDIGRGRIITERWERDRAQRAQ